MHYLPDSLYHIYNRGNQKQVIFFSPENYNFFVRKMGKFISTRCDLLSYCLMPNHFHMLIHTNEFSIESADHNKIGMQRLSAGIRLLLSSYTKAVNKKMDLTGNLFQQKTKSKLIVTEEENLGRTTFDYIHQNPLKAGLVTRLEKWHHSSFRDFTGQRRSTICNIKKATTLLHLPSAEILYKQSYEITKPAIEKKLLHSIQFIKDEFFVPYP